jgi:hypothetical protein
VCPIILFRRFYFRTSQRTLSKEETEKNRKNQLFPFFFFKPYQEPALQRKERNEKKKGKQNDLPVNEGSFRIK